ncbi:MAG: hypothetical protein LKF88_05720 [Microbacteriaceae bacterium]|jgi:hypothetical protein|nr:hypothetical protein [Microbacteriaceae bacterium]
MIGDLLLTWISETGTGRIADIRARASWLARTENLNLKDSATGRWLHDIAALGHCEVDWKHGKWSVAPPVITRLPLADGLAVLCGARRPRLLRAIRDREIYTEQARRTSSDHEIPSPCTILIPYERIRELEEAAAAIGATFSGCAAARITPLLSRAASAMPSAPPAYDSTFERLTNITPRIWQAASPRNPAPASGLYREQVNGRWQYLQRRNDTWYVADFPTSLFAELSRLGETVMRWRPDSDDHTRTGTLIIDGDIPLPPLHSRVLVLCSGFTPRFGTAAGTILYDNVPRKIAVRTAASLGQMLPVTS